MKIVCHELEEIKAAEIISEGIIINSINDALDIVGNLSYEHYNKLIISKDSLCPDFFDLKTGLAGDILQKFINYRFNIAIIGDFTEYDSKSLQDFIIECNKGTNINFVKTLEEALDL
ncbi:MAG: DUF4180 domain-containing protein [Candidatus Kapaibacterium sp.]|jgi:hypothetical protein